MTSELKQTQSIFPDYPRASQVVDKDGKFTPDFDLGMQMLFQALQTNYKDEGLLVPQLDIDQQNTIAALYTSFIGGSYNAMTFELPDISGQTIYDKTNYLLKTFVIGQDASTPPNVTLAQWVPLAFMLSNPGNPNGSVAGFLNWQCFDNLGNILYICTTAGDVTSAVWTAV